MSMSFLFGEIFDFLYPFASSSTIEVGATSMSLLFGEIFDFVNFVLVSFVARQFVSRIVVLMSLVVQIY